MMAKLSWEMKLVLLGDWLMWLSILQGVLRTVQIDLGFIIKLNSWFGFFF